MVAQFTVKTTNLEFDIYFLSLMSFSINRQVSHFIHIQKFYVFRFNVEKNFCSRKWGGGELTSPSCPLLSLRPCKVLHKPDMKYLLWNIIADAAVLTLLNNRLETESFEINKPYIQPHRALSSQNCRSSHQRCSVAKGVL